MYLTSTFLPSLSTFAGLKVRIADRVPRVQTFSYALFPGTEKSTPVDWKLLVADQIEGENIRCHRLLGDEQLSPLLDSFQNNHSKAVVLINTSDDYTLASGLTSGVTELHLPVIVVSKCDGERILCCLDEGAERDEDVYARIHADNMVDEVDLIEERGTVTTQPLPSPAKTTAALKKAPSVDSSISETILMYSYEYRVIISDRSHFCT